MRQVAVPPQGTDAPVPLRGTQSFVGVFVQVWKRPSLTAMEILWRWATAVPLLLLAWKAGGSAVGRVRPDWAALEAMTVFRPVELARSLEQVTQTVGPPVWHVLRWWLPLAVLVWTGVGTMGQRLIFRRQDDAFRGHGGAFTACAYLRSLGLLGVFALWFGAVAEAGRRVVVQPARLGGEPNLVLFVALAVGVTLVLFVGWSLISWVLDAARLFAVREGCGLPQSLRSALHARALRSKLIELNLVMGIVRVALIVLATVAIATPLPFESVEGPAFMVFWCSAVGLVYLAVSDLFQVVRRSAGLYLLQALEGDEVTAPR